MLDIGISLATHWHISMRRDNGTRSYIDSERFIHVGYASAVFFMVESSIPHSQDLKRQGHTAEDPVPRANRALLVCHSSRNGSNKLRKCFIIATRTSEKTGTSERTV